MSDARRDFWIEAVSESFDEHGITASAEQIEAIADDFSHVQDGIDLAFGRPSGPSPEAEQIKELERKLDEERDKVTCRICRGTGEERIDGPSHYSVQPCLKCRGQGRHLP